MKQISLLIKLYIYMYINIYLHMEHMYICDIYTHTRSWFYSSDKA